MIEEYIEKNILRQLFLCGQFYVNKEVNLEKLSYLLHVCKTTLLNDINNIKKEFEEQIAYTHREKDRYTLYFSEHIPRCKIMQQLSQNSLFLKTCLLYLEEDEPDYLQLTECEFICYQFPTPASVCCDNRFKIYRRNQKTSYLQLCRISMGKH